VIRVRDLFPGLYDNLLFTLPLSQGNSSKLTLFLMSQQVLRYALSTITESSILSLPPPDHNASDGLKVRAAPFMQYLKPVGGGPSIKT
jgi:hypothetical protein